MSPGREDATALIEAHLDRNGWSHQPAKPARGRSEGAIATRWSDSTGRSFVMSIVPADEDGVVLFEVRSLARSLPSVTPSEYVRDLTIVMAALNFKLSLGRWAFDPNQGEVAFFCGVATDDITLPFPLFKHALDAVVSAVETGAPILKSILNGQRTAAEALAVIDMRLG